MTGGAALSKKAKTGEELTTIADRLEQLVDVLDKPDRALVAAGPSDSRALVAKGGRAPPKADSLVVVLEQVSSVQDRSWLGPGPQETLLAMICYNLNG